MRIIEVVVMDNVCSGDGAYCSHAILTEKFGVYHCPFGACFKDFESPRELPLCWRDGQSCPHDLACDVSTFGIMAEDGDSEVVWTCPRFVVKGAKRPEQRS